MGLLDRAIETEREITIGHLTRLGFRLRPNLGGLGKPGGLVYWFHGEGSSYVKVTMTYGAEFKAYVEDLTYCSTENGSQWWIKSVENPNLDDLELVVNIVKNNKWR